jgi:hypothetical protein
MNVRALRLPAYLLIVHFLIASALALAARGDPDYMRIGTMLAFLIVAVSALFNPRRRGWIVVLGYVLYLLAYQAVGIWTALGSPSALPFGAKLVAAAVWGVLFALPATALIFTLMPANFAAFANPPSNDDVAAQPGAASASTGVRIEQAGAGPSAGIPGSQPTASGRNAAVLVAVVVAAAIVAAYAYRLGARSEWMTSAQYQRDFDTRAPKGFYPQEVEGRCEAGSETYLPDWKPQPPGAAFFSYFGMTREGYDNKNREYAAQGFSLVSVKHFSDCSGVERYQATWLKR